MKKIIYSFAFLLIVQLALTIDNCEAQWQTDVRLTNAPDTSRFTSSNNSQHIASNGNLVHVVWNDKRDGNFEIYYKRSTNGGVNWEQDVRLTNDIAASSSASIAVSGSIVHIVWVDYRTGTFQLFYKRSTDEGISWEADTQLTTSIGYGVSGPSIKVSGTFVHVFWHDFRDAPYAEIYYKRSTDGGSTWGTDIRFTNNPVHSCYPSCDVSGSVVHVAWCDSRSGACQVYYNYSADAGLNWSIDTKLSNSSMTTIYGVNLSVSGSDVFIVWQDNRDGNNEIYYKRSTDRGINWELDTRLTYDTASSLFPSVLISGSNVHIVWYDNRDGNNEIYYKLSTDKGLIWGTDTRLTNDASLSRKPFISISDSVLHIVWDDNRDGNYEIYYKRNPTGNPIGIININSEIPKEYRLMQNYPNPFNPITKIKFDVPSNVKGETSNVNMVVFDILGREVANLVNEQLKPGTYEVNFDGINYPSGVYYYQLVAGDYRETKKMILIK